MKYSVIIPLYNKENYICHTLESVLAQTFQDFEVIVVDDGSTDASLKKAEQISSEKIQIVKQKNLGVSVARNTGIACASGSYIAFLDADDEWNEDYLETIDRLTKSYPESDLYVTAYQIDMGNGTSRESSRLDPEEGCLDSYWMTFQHSYDFVWTSATVVKKDAVIKAGGFRPGEYIGQDLDLWARIAKNNAKVAYSSSVCAIYNRTAENNARDRVKIAYGGAFLKDLEEELFNPRHTIDELSMIQRKYNLKMTIYIFTCILAGERKRAREACMSWKGKNSWKIWLLKSGLKIAMFMPEGVNRWIYAVRLKVF